MGTRRSIGGHRDANHTPIVEALEKAGAQVQDLAAVGNGCPDLLVGWQRRLFVLELKDENQPKCRRKLREVQEAWFKRWGEFPCYVVTSPIQAVDLLNHITRNGSGNVEWPGS